MYTLIHLFPTHLEMKLDFLYNSHFLQSILLRNSSLFSIVYKTGEERSMSSAHRPIKRPLGGLGHCCAWCTRSSTTVEVLTDSLVRVFSFLCRKSSFKVVEGGLLIPFSINDRRDWNSPKAQFDIYKEPRHPPINSGGGRYFSRPINKTTRHKHSNLDGGL